MGVLTSDILLQQETYLRSKQNKKIENQCFSLWLKSDTLWAVVSVSSERVMEEEEEMLGVIACRHC